MLKLTAVIWVVLCPFFLIAQSVDIQWGESIDSKTEILRIIGEDQDQNVYALAYKSKKYYLEKYKGNELVASFSKEIVFPEIDDRDQNLLNIYLLDNKLVAISEVFLKKTDEYLVNGYGISLSGIMEKKPVELLRISAKTRSKAGITGTQISQDRSLFLVSNVSFDDKDQNDISIQVFNNEFKRQNHFDEKVTIKNKAEKAYVTIGNFVLDNTGSMYYTKEVMYYKGSFTFSSSMLNDRDYSVVHLNEEGFKQEIPVTLKNLKVAQMGLKVDENNNIKLGGFYYKKQERGLFKGVYLRGSFFVLIDGKTRKKLAENAVEFSEDMMLEYRSEKQIDKGVYLDNNFYVKEMVNKDNGGTIIIAEYFTVVYGETRMGLQPVNYYYGDLIVVNVNKEGEIEWSKAIFKNQLYTQTRLNLGAFVGGLSVMASIPVSNDETIYFSYLVDVVGDDIVFIFNDNGANTNLDLPRRKTKALKVPKKGIPMIVTFDKKGTMSKEPLAKSLKGEVIMRPRVSYVNTDNDTIVVYGSKSGDDKLGRLSIR